MGDDGVAVAAAVGVEEGCCCCDGRVFYGCESCIRNHQSREWNPLWLQSHPHCYCNRQAVWMMMTNLGYLYYWMKPSNGMQ